MDFYHCTGLEAKVTSIKGAKAAFSSPACSLWPYKFVSQLLARLAHCGALNLQTNTPVVKVVADDGVSASVVHTTRGAIRAKKVVFATNAYTHPRTRIRSFRSWRQLRISRLQGPSILT